MATDPTRIDNAQAPTGTRDECLEKSGGIEIDDKAVESIAQAQLLAKALATAAKSFADRTLRFVHGPSDVVEFLKDLQKKVSELSSLLARVDAEPAEVDVPQGVPAIAKQLGALLQRVVKAIGEAPADFRKDLGDAIEWLDKLNQIAARLPTAEDVTELSKEDLTTPVLEDGGAVLPEQAGTESRALGIGEIVPSYLAQLTDEALDETDAHLHRFYTRWFVGTDRMTFRGKTRESLVNAERFIQAEYKRRGSKHRREDELAEAARKLEKAGSKAEELAQIHSSGETRGDEILIRDVLEHCKSFKLRMPIAYLVGGLANHGKTANDIDILIKGPLGEELEHVLKFRLGRMFPPELSKRIQFLDDEFGGPFTNHIELADLVVEMRPEFRIKRMRAEKQDDPLLDLPPAGAGPRPAVLQAHHRGASLHLDLRIKANDHLIGWTLAAQKPGIPSVDTVADARSIADTIDRDGGRYTKPFVAPAKIYATPKSRQPEVWLTIDGEVFEPGEVGATAEGPGVIVAVDKPKAEFGLQKPFSHEYFFSHGKVLNGILYFRQLVGEGGPEVEEEAGRRARPGETFWTCWLSKDLLPSVLKPRAVKTKSMPPDGYSAIPQSLEKATPKEFRYWEKKGDEARKIRDALVESRFFTADNIKLVDGEFRRVERKFFLVEPTEEAPEFYAKRFRDYLAKQPRTARFALSWQYWKGQTVVRAAPSREVWHLILETPSGLETWKLARDPLSGESPIAGVHKKRKSKDLLEYSGTVDPGQEIGGEVLNDTKATPSAIRLQDEGKVEVLEDSEVFKKLRFRGEKLNGLYTLIAEEAGSSIWQLARGEEAGRAVPTEKRWTTEALTLASGEKLTDVQIWDPGKIEEDDDKAGDRKKLRPLAIFQPMKVAPRATNRFTEVDEAIEKFATDEMLRSGIWVEPKYNGFRVVLSKDRDGRTLLVTEEALDRKTPIANLLDNLPRLAKEAAAISGPYVLDAEFVAFDEHGEPMPRRDLAQFRGKEKVDDSGVRLQVFDALYHPREGNVTDRPQSERRKLADSLVQPGGLIELSPARRVRSRAELENAMGWAVKQPWSEGAMLKAEDATYSLGGESDLWAKWKATRSLMAIVYDRKPVKDTPSVWNYLGAIGPVSAKEAGNWKETVKVRGKLYVPIGVTANSKLDLKVGDTMIVDAFELLLTEGPPKMIAWFGPATIVEKAPAGEAPNTIEETLELLREGERKSSGLVVKSATCIDKAVDVLACLAPVNPASREAMAEIRRRLEGDGEQRFALGVVLEPETEDSQHDVYSKAEVKNAAERYARDFERLKLMHKGGPINDRARVLGCYLAVHAFEFQEEKVKKGTWLMALSVPDDALWLSMKAGDLTGLSIGGDAVRVAEK